MFPIVEPIFGPVSSSSTASPQSPRYRITRSATARSSPGGLGTAASSKNNLRTSGCTGRRGYATSTLTRRRAR